LQPCINVADLSAYVVTLILGAADFRDVFDPKIVARNAKSHAKTQINRQKTANPPMFFP
jgi:hypothetical protein